MRRGFNEYQMMRVPITENQLGSMQMMQEVSEHVGMIFPEILDSRYVAQPVIDFLFSWEEEMGSAEKGFSKTMTPRNTAPQQPPAMKLQPDLCFIEKLQSPSAARQLFE